MGTGLTSRYDVTSRHQKTASATKLNAYFFIALPRPFMFIDETLYDDAFLKKKIFTGATLHASKL